MSTYQSLLLGIRSSGDYFISTFMFGVMFGIAASAAGLSQWQALLMSASSFTASGQFAALEFWQSPLPYGTIALSVALVSSRNILLGMAMTHRFDGHSLKRRIVWLFLLNDPGVVTSYRLEQNVDRLGYITGYGMAIMASWLSSTWLGLSVADIFTTLNLGEIDFAGPLVIATMMMLFIKGSKTRSTPWIVSSIVALILFELETVNYLVLLLSVAAGVTAAVIQERQLRG
jgi:predicted branched-subunit amino acid permease